MNEEGLEGDGIVGDTQFQDEGRCARTRQSMAMTVPVVGLDWPFDPLRALDDQVPHPGPVEITAYIVRCVEHGGIPRPADPIGQVGDVVGDDEERPPGASALAADRKAARRCASGS